MGVTAHLLIVMTPQRNSTCIDHVCVWVRFLDAAASANEARGALCRFLLSLHAPEPCPGKGCPGRGLRHPPGVRFCVKNELEHLSELQGSFAVLA